MSSVKHRRIAGKVRVLCKALFETVTSPCGAFAPAFPQVKRRV
jgi:hypothetical protein